ncbi:hypothetical protein [Streptomyces sp. NPDC007083]|uniref:hypothetical protein n=1 Tax=Streptomyces sp. NPDC007083 TaxID=3156913 RepID=UPI00340314BC
MTERRRRPIAFDPSLVTPDLKALHRAAVQNPRGPEDRLLRVTLNHLDRIRNGGKSTHRLEYMPTYPDLSDCETTYVGTDSNRKPSHRLIWRERIPQDPRQPIVREIVALGERENGQAYHAAGQRLNRPVGFTLSELSMQREPIASRYRPPHIDRGVDVPSSVESDLEFN